MGLSKSVLKIPVEDTSHKISVAGGAGEKGERSPPAVSIQKHLVGHCKKHKAGLK